MGVTGSVFDVEGLRRHKSPQPSCAVISICAKLRRQRSVATLLA
jgi:hypothetical protein